MERVNLVRAERTREVSKMNRTLYEFLLPEEEKPAEDHVVSHAVIKADVRGSTRMTQDLLSRGLNPASHLSLNLYEPVQKVLDRYGASKVFIEGDAIVMAIYETEANRMRQRAVAKSCLLARQIVGIAQAYNQRSESSELAAIGNWRWRCVSEFAANLLDGQRFAHHDFARAESFRSSFELLESGAKTSGPAEFAIPFICFSNDDGRNHRRRVG